MTGPVVGIDLGGTKLASVRMHDGQVVARARLTNTSEQDGLVECALAGIEAVWEPGIATVGVGVAGLVSWPDGVFTWGPHVSGAGVSLRADLEDRLDVPVTVDNDANTTLFGEALMGSAIGHDDVILVTLGTGIGGGILAGGQIYRGRSYAGEFGHLVLDHDGPLCACGQRGCWETLASGPAIGRLAVEAGMDDPSPEAVLTAARAGEPTALRIVGQAGDQLGRGLAMLAAALDPELIVVGGGLGVAAGELLLDPARQRLDTTLHGRAYRDPPPIVVALLGAEGGAVGAASLAGRRFEEGQDD